MAAITSTQSGNWSSTDTWAGGVVPGNGDSAILAHDVTVDTNTIIGTDDVSGTEAITVQQGVTLTISAELKCRGDLRQYRGSTITFSANSSLILDSPAAGKRYKWDQQAALGTGTAYTTGDGGDWDNFITINGDGGRGGDYGYIEFYDTTSLVDIDWAFIKLLNLGTAAVKGLNWWPGNTTLNFKMYDALIQNCGEVRVVGNFDTTDIDVVRCDFREQTGQFSVYGSDATPINIKRVIDCTFYNTNMFQGFYNGCTGLDQQGTVFYNTYNGFISNRGWDIKNHISFFDQTYILPLSIAVTPTTSYGKVEDSVFLSSDTGSGHFIGAFGNDIAPGLISGCYFDGAGVGFNIGVAIGTERQWDVKNNIFANNAGSIEFSNPHVHICEYSNNTFVDDSGIRERNFDPGASLTAKNNIFYNALGIFQELGYSYTADINPIIDYNASFGSPSAYLDFPVGHPFAGQDSELSNEVNGSRWDDGSVWGVDHGANSIVVNPNFKNEDFTLLGHMGVSTVQEAGQEVVKLNGWDYQGNRTTATTVTAVTLLAAARDAYTPTNPALKGTGEGGVDIGALPVVPTVSISGLGFGSARFPGFGW